MQNYNNLWITCYLCTIKFEYWSKKMLNRRILRTKAFKTVYGYAENSSMTLKEA